MHVILTTFIAPIQEESLTLTLKGAYRIIRSMKVYLVGGCVRDKLLGLTPKDFDYVVVGATPEQMLALGYKQVGADFPVFLDDEGVEYALARTERKSGTGYNGFVCDFNPTTTLEDDLRRRDLTINAMALDPDTNEIIDPFGGQEDLKRGMLRHVSEAFAEDPLRVLRVARFAARYDFKVAFDTILLMQSLRNELTTLTPERVWVELSKAFMEKHPSNFYHTLVECACWDVLFPEVNSTSIPLLQKAAEINMPFGLRMAAFLRETLIIKADNFLDRLKGESDIIRLVHNIWKVRVASQEYVLTYEKAQVLLDLMKATDAFRRPDGFLLALDVWRLSHENVAFADDAQEAFTLANRVRFADLPFASDVVKAGTKAGAEIARTMDYERFRRISAKFDNGRN